MIIFSPRLRSIGLLLVCALAFAGCIQKGGHSGSMDQGKRDIARYNDFKDREAILGDYYETSGVWETMSQGFSLPSLDDTIADDYEHWLKTHPVHFRTLSKRATLVLPYLIEEIQRRFGSSARFFTCAAESMTAEQLVDFLETRGKFVQGNDGFSTDASLMCSD